MITPFTLNTNDVSQSVLTTDPLQGGRAGYRFTIPSTGTYSVSLVVNAVDGGSNSLFVNIDSEPTVDNTFDIPVTTGFESRTLSWRSSTGVITDPKWFTLTAGQHQMVVRGREADTIVRTITLASTGGTPTPTPTPTATPIAPTLISVRDN